VYVSSILVKLLWCYWNEVCGTFVLCVLWVGSLPLFSLLFIFLYTYMPLQTIFYLPVHIFVRSCIVPSQCSGIHVALTYSNETVETKLRWCENYGKGNVTAKFIFVIWFRFFSCVGSS
jgi:hypothetical protein